jgi:hypothetical protein
VTIGTTSTEHVSRDKLATHSHTFVLKIKEEALKALLKMPPLSNHHPQHNRSDPQTFPGQSIRPASIMNAPSTSNSTGPAATATSAPAYGSSGARTSAGNINSVSTAKSRQYAHLHSQLAQLNAHLADTENLVRMTAVQAGDMRFLGGYVGGLFMGAAKVLGEEGVKAGGGGAAGGASATTVSTATGWDEK